ncbi:ATP-binding protein [Lutibacter sp.]|uniref:ATP-binding protein n=1 Tax=Lutibacter sp. TaxID=1925666 RepID=UPI0025BBAB36|nr:ATP-binding protein [Lutibacter sp.]MCF6182642.1 ATP-binding protein [Lutibacter sp.]
MIERILEKKLISKFYKGKTILILGPRQVGKTTLLKKIASNLKAVLWLNADNFEIQSLFEVASSTRFKLIVKNYKVVIIDEAQSIKNIGLKLKIIADEIKDVQIIATGSSAFDLANELNEPLTGRKYEFQMYPISFEEMVNYSSLLEELNLLSHRIIYGYYPDVVINQEEEKDLLKLLADSYLFKDILIWNKIKKSDKIIKLLQALSFQIGNQVSYNNLGNLIGLDSETVERYIILLEKSFIIYRLNSYSKNLRSELKKSRKIYFTDNGIRNAVIGNYSAVNMRNDVGSLWENYIISERIKFTNYHNVYVNRYFWRTKTQQEIDYIEEIDGKLFAYEFKWSPHKKAKISRTFTNAYPNAIVKIITPENFEEFITHQE